MRNNLKESLIGLEVAEARKDVEERIGGFNFEEQR
jgi:hypothetical protein